MEGRPGLIPLALVVILMLALAFGVLMSLMHFMPSPTSVDAVAVKSGVEVSWSDTGADSYRIAWNDSTIEASPAGRRWGQNTRRVLENEAFISPLMPDKEHVFTVWALEDGRITEAPIGYGVARTLPIGWD